MADSKVQQPSTLAEDKENDDIHVLLRAAEAIASPTLKKESTTKISFSILPEATVAVASLQRESAALPSLSRIISNESDGETSFKPSPDQQRRESMMSQSVVSQSSASIVAPSKKAEDEDASNLICREIIPSEKTDTVAAATAATSSTLKKESSNPLKRARQPGPDFWTFTKKSSSSSQGQKVVLCRQLLEHIRQ
jgi:hypothetical protein